MPDYHRVTLHPFFNKAARFRQAAEAYHQYRSVVDSLITVAIRSPAVLVLFQSAFPRHSPARSAQSASAVAVGLASRAYALEITISR